MNGIHLIIFLASWTVIAANKLPFIFEAENECPTIDTCPPKLISHEWDCSKYYECQYGQRQLRSCAAGLFFSKRWRGCVKQEISDCVTTWSPTTPTTTTPIDGCVHGDLLRHECKCEKFYECVHGNKALRECQEGHIFYPETKTCQPGNKDDCKPTPIQCLIGQNKPHECQCKKYYTCIAGNKWALRECGQGKHFDNVTLTCVEGENCGKQPLCYNDDKEKHECDCNKYYICKNENWIVENCPDGLHFSETQKRCMNPREAGCDDDIRPRPGDCPISTPPKWPHECDCRLYYQCENEKKKIYECSWGFYFDNAGLKCDAAANVKNCRNSWDDWV